jgi:cell division protein FtsQ
MARKPAGIQSDWRIWPIITRALFGLIVLAGGMFAFHRLENFLISDPRFLLAPSPEYGVDPPGFTISGVSRASRKSVINAFANDFERSVYLMPIEKRRTELLRIEWIREATIARFWPNQIFVRVEERKPAAFFQDSIPGQSKSTIWLIDEDGMLLHIPSQMTFRLPVVTGFRATAKPEERSRRVLRMLRLMKDVKNYGARISEVDVSDMDNLKAMVQAPDSRAMVLWLGDKNFYARMEDFERSYAEIRRRLPGVSTLDMRLDGRISVVEGKGE